MEITEDTECLCLCIETKEIWDIVTKDVLDIGWSIPYRDPDFGFKYNPTILYIGIAGVELGYLYYSTISYYKDEHIRYLKSNLLITIVDLNILIVSGQLLVLLI